MFGYFGNRPFWKSAEFVTRSMEDSGEQGTAELQAWYRPTRAGPRCRLAITASSIGILIVSFVFRRWVRAFLITDRGLAFWTLGFGSLAFLLWPFCAVLVSVVGCFE